MHPGFVTVVLWSCARMRLIGISLATGSLCGLILMVIICGSLLVLRVMLGPLTVRLTGRAVDWEVRSFIMR